MSGRIKKPRRIRLNRLGKIKIGKKNDKGYPMSVDYFLAKGQYAGFFNETYGAKPKTIQIVFIDDDPANVCEERYEYRDNQGKLYAYGDGEIYKVFNKKTEQYDEMVDVNGDLQEKVHDRLKAKAGWTITLTLRFVLPAIKGLAGYWELTTKGKASSIENIRDTFDTIKEMNGTAKGVLFDLHVEFAVSQKPNSRSKYPVVTMFVNETPANIELVKDSPLVFNPKLLQR